MREQLIFIENELQEANEENGNYDDVILALGKTIRNLKSALKRRNINDSLNKDFQVIKQCNTIRPEIEARSKLMEK